MSQNIIWIIKGSFILKLICFAMKHQLILHADRETLLDFKCTITRPSLLSSINYSHRYSSKKLYLSRKKQRNYSHWYRYRTVQVAGIQKKSKKNGDAPSEFNHFWDIPLISYYWTINWSSWSRSWVRRRCFLPFRRDGILQPLQRRIR